MAIRESAGGVTQLSEALSRAVMDRGKVENDRKSLGTRCEVVVSWNVWIVGDVDGRGYESQDC